MDKVAEISTPNYDSEMMLKLLDVYDAQSDNIRLSLAKILNITNSSFFVADAEAAHALQEDGRRRSSYDGLSDRLMENDNALGDDPFIDERTIELIVTAVNDYLSGYPKLPDQSTESGRGMLNEIKVLFIQLITSHALNLSNDIVIPDYMKEYVEKAHEVLNEGANRAFHNLIQDFIETGNEDLVDYVQVIGWDIFGWNVKTKAKGTWSNYMNPYLSTLKNPDVLYKRYLTCRSEFSSYANEVQNSILYPVFEISKDVFRHKQSSLYDKFCTYYNQNVDLNSIKKLIYGI